MPCNNRTFTLWRLHVHFLLINVANRWSNLNGEKKNYALLMCYWCLCQHIFFSSTDARVKQTTDKVGTAAPYQCPNFCSKASWLGGGGERHSFFHLNCYLRCCRSGYMVLGVLNLRRVYNSTIQLTSWRVYLSGMDTLKRVWTSVMHALKNQPHRG